MVTAINQNDKIKLTIFGREKEIKIISQRLLLDKIEDEILNEKEMEELNWLLSKDFINQLTIKDVIKEYCQQMYDNLNEHISGFNINNEVSINDIVVQQNDDDTFTIAYCGEAKCDPEHGISINFNKRKFVGIGEYLDYEFASTEETLFVD